MRRFLFAAPLLLCAFGDLTMARAEAPMPTAASDTEDVSECIQLDQELVPAGISFNFHNTCDAPVRCHFSWSLRCDADTATGAPARLSNHTFSLQAGRKRIYIADTTACGDDGWSIGSDTWDCVER